MFKHNLQGHGARKAFQPRFFWPAALLMVTALMLLMPTGYNTAHAVPISNTEAASKQVQPAAEPVAVTLYVMSQCPDARFCQNAFKPVLETLPSVMTVRTEYIAKLQEEDTVACMHGSAECDGNKQQLCLQHHLPAAENHKYFQALLCHGKGRVNDITRLQSCMTDAGVDSAVQAKVLQCVDGTLGTTLQVASAKQVTAHSVVKSCTVFIDGNKRCIRDGGRWYDCEAGSDTQSFIKSICEAYKAKAGKSAPECEAAVGQASAQ